MQRDRAAQEAKPKSAESPLIVIPIPKWRTYFALAFITVFFLGLVCRAVWLQAVTTDFLQDQGEARYARTLTIAGDAGEILDRNGVVLAASQPVRSIWADPAFAKKLSADDFKKLADVLQMKPKEVRDKIFKAKSKNFTYLARTQDVRTAEAVRLLKLPASVFRQKCCVNIPMARLSLTLWDLPAAAIMVKKVLNWPETRI